MSRKVKFRLSKNERILRAIVGARLRYKDDYDFAKEVNGILIREGVLKKGDFGRHER